MCLLYFKQHAVPVLHNDVRGDIVFDALAHQIPLGIIADRPEVRSETVKK